MNGKSGSSSPAEVFHRDGYVVVRNLVGEVHGCSAVVFGSGCLAQWFGNLPVVFSSLGDVGSAGGVLRWYLLFGTGWHGQSLTNSGRRHGLAAAHRSCSGRFAS